MKKLIKEKIINRLGMSNVESMVKILRPSEISVSVLGDVTVSGENATIEENDSNIKNVNGDVKIIIQLKY